MHRSLLAAVFAAAALTAPSLAQKGPPTGETEAAPGPGVPAPLRPSAEEARTLLVGEWSADDPDEDLYLQLFADGQVLIDDGGSDVETGYWEVRDDGYGGLEIIAYENIERDDPNVEPLVFLTEDRILIEDEGAFSRVSFEPGEATTGDGWTTESATAFLVGRWVGDGNGGLTELTLMEGGRAIAVQSPGGAEEPGIWRVLVGARGDLTIIAGPDGDTPDSGILEILDDNTIRIADDFTMRRADAGSAMPAPSPSPAPGPKG